MASNLRSTNHWLESLGFWRCFVRRDPAVVAKRVEWESAVGKQRGWLVRSETAERLPVLMLITSTPSDEFAMQSSRELAGIGFAVLIAELDPETMGSKVGSVAGQQHETVAREHALAQLSAAARWMKRRNDVFADKLGALGWGPMGRWALEVAAAQSFQAAVLVDVDLPLEIDAPLSVGLRHTAVLFVRGAADSSILDSELFARLKNGLGDAQIERRAMAFDTAKKGFMDGRRAHAFDQTAADRAWFEIYEFVGKYVEDAELVGTFGAGGSSKGANSGHPFVSIGDLMRAVNAPSGVYGAIVETLRSDSLKAKDWILLRSRAAVMADSGVSLMGLNPPRGSAARFHQHAASYRDAAEDLIKAAEQHDVAEARHASERLKVNCSSCHADHR